jgi:hypothetical protein
VPKSTPIGHDLTPTKFLTNPNIIGAPPSPIRCNPSPSQPALAGNRAVRRLCTALSRTPAAAMLIDCKVEGV